MSSSAFQVRRATLDDLAQLTALWRTMHFDTGELARRATEFQVAVAADGQLAGAIGLRIEQKQGRIHSEAFHDFSHADQVRPLFWERLNALAHNHGLLRFWTLEEAPFWKQCGLLPAEEEALGKLPPSWRAGRSGWLTLKLREDVHEIIAADHDFALLIEAERQRAQRVRGHARALRVAAVLIALAVLALVAVGAVMILRHRFFLPR